MTQQTEAQRLIAILENRRMDDEQEAKQDIEAAKEMRRLEAANAELLQALKMNAQVVSWLSFGECRGFTEGLPTALEATCAAKVAIKKHGGT